MKKVALIIPYFGSWPEWFELYLYSCSKNKMIDFLFFTDCEIPYKRYSNTFFQEISFDDYCLRVSQCLQINFSPLTPRKLCDLKPFYGMIHEKELQDYDFWGFGDIDLIYGDLSNLINEHMLSRYDVITTHSPHIAGHFTIIRKKSKYTNLPIQIKGWESALSNPKVVVFDEGAFSAKVNPLLRLFRFFYFRVNRFFKSDKYRDCQKFNDLVKWITPHLFFHECYSTVFMRNDANWKYNLQNGTLEATTGILRIPPNEGITYVHFYLFKDTIQSCGNPCWTNNCYHIPKGYDFEQSSRCVIVNKDGIALLE